MEGFAQLYAEYERRIKEDLGFRSVAEMRSFPPMEERMKQDKCMYCNVATSTNNRKHNNKACKYCLFLNYGAYVDGWMDEKIFAVNLWYMTEGAKQGLIWEDMKKLEKDVEK
jgi:hypothetical protein